jgi:hypothetical protein
VGNQLCCCCWSGEKRPTHCAADRLKARRCSKVLRLSLRSPRKQKAESIWLWNTRSELMPTCTPDTRLGQSSPIPRFPVVGTTDSFYTSYFCPPPAVNCQCRCLLRSQKGAGLSFICRRVAPRSMRYPAAHGAGPRPRLVCGRQPPSHSLHHTMLHSNTHRIRCVAPYTTVRTRCCMSLGEALVDGEGVCGFVLG